MKTYYNPDDLKKFGNIGEFQQKMEQIHEKVKEEWEDEFWIKTES